MKPRLISTSLFNTFDLIFTLFLVSLFGLGIEANPIGKVMLQNTTLLIIGKIVVVNLLLLLMYRLKHLRIAKIGSWVVFASYSLLTIYHISGLIFLMIY